MNANTNKINNLENIMRESNIDIVKSITTKGIQDDMYTWITYELPNSFKLILYDVKSEDKLTDHDTYLKAELLSPQLQIINQEVAEYAESVAKNTGLSLDKRGMQSSFSIKLNDPLKIIDSLHRLAQGYQLFIKQKEY